MIKSRIPNLASCAEMEISSPDLDEVLAPAFLQATTTSLRLLARWLLAAAREGAPLADSNRPGVPQNQLDVSREAKVGSVSETPEMPVQQAVQRRDQL
jgi:hypothetical protein